MDKKVETVQEIKKVVCLWDGFASGAKDTIQFMDVAKDILYIVHLEAFVWIESLVHL